MTQATPYPDGASPPPRKKDSDSWRSRLRGRTLTVTLTLPQAIFGLLLAIFIVVWVFIFGIMIGRGHNPEEVVPPLAGVMPNRTSSPAVVETETPPDVIPQTDLQYHDSLKTKAPQPKSAATPPAAPPAVKAEAPKPKQPPATTAQSTRPATGQGAKPATTQGAKPGTGQAAKPGASATTPPAASPDSVVYNYVYQVAAVNNAAGAQAMQKKLQANGLAASIAQSDNNGKTWYRILVSFKGTPEDTRTLRAKLAEHGISAIILRGKTPTR